MLKTFNKITEDRRAYAYADRYFPQRVSTPRALRLYLPLLITSPPAWPSRGRQAHLQLDPAWTQETLQPCIMERKVSIPQKQPDIKLVRSIRMPKVKCSRFVRLLSRSLPRPRMRSRYHRPQMRISMVPQIRMVLFSYTRTQCHTSPWSQVRLRQDAMCSCAASDWRKLKVVLI